MKQIYQFIIVCVLLSAFANSVYASEVLSTSQSTIPGDPSLGATTTATSYSTALSVTASVSSAANVLVITSFSIVGGGGGGRNMLWKSTYGVQESVVMKRYLSGSSDTGNASAVHLFSDVPSGNQTFNLDFASSQSGKSVTLFGASMCAIPMVTDQGSILASSMGSLTSEVPVSVTTYTDIGLVTTVNVDRVASDNSIFMAVALNSSSAGTEVEGMWRLEIREEGETWIDTGAETRRYLSGISDQGAISLFGLATNLSSGTYEVRVTARSLTDTVPVNTFGATLAAVSLGYTNATESAIFPSRITSATLSTNNATVWSTINGLETEVSYTENIDTFAALSLAGITYLGANNTGEFRIAMTNSLGQAQQTVEVERFFSGGNDWGSVGVVGVFTNISAGTTTFLGEQRRTAGTTLTDYSTLTIFETRSEATLKRGTVTLMY